MQSRIMREFKSKATKPFDLAKVTTIEDEADNERVQKQLGNGLHFTMEHAKPKKRALRTVTEYLDALWILMLALAIAGSDRVMPRPVNKDGSLRIEMPTDNPHDFTVIPLSLLKKYFDRCKNNSSKVHDRDALFWLKDRAPPSKVGRKKTIEKMSDAEIAGPRKAKGGNKAGTAA